MPAGRNVNKHVRHLATDTIPVTSRQMQLDIHTSFTLHYCILREETQNNHSLTQNVDKSGRNLSRPIRVLLSGMQLDILRGRTREGPCWGARRSQRSPTADWTLTRMGSASREECKQTWAPPSYRYHPSSIRADAA